MGREKQREKRKRKRLLAAMSSICTIRHTSLALFSPDTHSLLIKHWTGKLRIIADHESKGTNSLVSLILLLQQQLTIVLSLERNDAEPSSYKYRSSFVQWRDTLQFDGFRKQRRERKHSPVQLLSQIVRELFQSSTSYPNRPFEREQMGLQQMWQGNCFGMSRESCIVQFNLDLFVEIQSESSLSNTHSCQTVHV